MFDVIVRNNKTGETAGFSYKTRELADHCTEMFPQPAYTTTKEYEDIVVVEDPDADEDYPD